MGSPDDDKELMISFMLKRSLGKRSFMKDNYKNRFFVLTSIHLKYYDGTIEKGRGKVKGCILLKSVKTVASVKDGELDNNNYVLQVVYDDGVDYQTLYIVAENDAMKNSWIQSLRAECEKIGASLTSTYHSGVWSRKRGSFSCCNQLFKSACGCTEDPVRQSVIPDDVRALPLPPMHANDGQCEVRVAMYDYAAADNNDLDLAKGEKYGILDSARENWWLARNSKGITGYVPANYLRNIVGLEAYTWYFPNISRQRAEAMLAAENKDGGFLIRDSVQKPGAYTLSLFTFEGNVRGGGCVKHYHVKDDPDGFYISKTHVFPTIAEVINYHKHNGAGLISRLKHIPNTNDTQPVTAGFGCEKWEIDPNEIQILEELGRGQFGCVRKGIWRGVTDVAVKMMNPHSMSEDEFIEEAKTMTQLQHPNLVQLYGVSHQRPIYIVVEYLVNGALQNFLRKNRANLLARTGNLMDMCIQVCGAMEYLESKSVIHRDLASRNCLVGHRSVVKVCDFGLARHVLDDEYKSSSGTKFPVRWVPPEVLAYTKYSSKSDVWAFGVLIWEVFTCGSTPYGRMKNHEVAEYVERGRVLERPPHCPSRLYELMVTCWTSRADNRPGFTEVLASLDGIMESDYQD